MNTSITFKSLISSDVVLFCVEWYVLAIYEWSLPVYLMQETCSHYNSSRFWSSEPHGASPSMYRQFILLICSNVLPAACHQISWPRSPKKAQNVEDWWESWYVWERGLLAGLRLTDWRRVTGEATEGGASLHYTYPSKALATCTYNIIQYYTEHYTYPCKARELLVLTIQYYTTLTPVKPVKLCWMYM